MGSLLTKKKPCELLARLESLGWPVAAAAVFLDCSRQHLYDMINDRARKRHWDIAIWNLPKYTSALAKEIAAIKPRKRTTPATTAITPGYRLSGEFVPGLLVVAEKYIGEVADEGAEGIVLEVRDSGDSEEYLIRFTGGCDWFGPDFIESHIASTGKVVSH
ncbi:hypothetical protein HA052_04770 [Chromobacterium haemolyticum]|uniref:Uncharacterized protein n=1 Tax=Chromobacterium fluminis TaxID=3044269 RepID=A0ABX0L610_9NEIS|nr:hypothetical protein [Chromobacterium haemolyticum]NHR04503.1 hypothetical protein [Chromobacterium haemolyticum]